jgi:predicted amidohydrolase YtcJ
LGISQNTPQVEGGQFDLDDAGHPNGIFRENALGLLSPLQVSLSVDERVSLLNQVSAIANQYGITSVQTNDLTIGNAESEVLEEAYHRYASENPTVRIYHQVSFSDLEAFKTRIQRGYHAQENDFNRYGPLKLFIDGSLGARTARLRQPYHDEPSTQGIQCMTSEVLDSYITTADQNGISVAVHAIGDGAMAQVLDSYQKVIASENTLRHGIVHCQITDLPLLKRFKALDILAYVQPIFLHYDMHMVESRVGYPLASTSYAFNTMEKLGLHVAYGTDSPVEGLNVFHNIHCAINRQDLSFFPDQGFFPSEKVDLETAIDNYTCGSAYASFEEDHKGRLLPGYMADLVVVDQPLFSLDPSQVKTVQVTMTMVNGKVVYTR